MRYGPCSSGILAVPGASEIMVQCHWQDVLVDLGLSRGPSCATHMMVARRQLGSGNSDRNSRS